MKSEAAIRNLKFKFQSLFVCFELTLAILIDPLFCASYDDAFDL